VIFEGAPGNTAKLGIGKAEAKGCDLWRKQSLLRIKGSGRYHEQQQRQQQKSWKERIKKQEALLEETG